MSCSILACAVEMPCASAVSTSVMASAPLRRRRPGPRSHCRSCRCSPPPWLRGHAASLHSSPARTAGRSPRSHAAMRSVPPAGSPAFPALLMVCASSQRRAWRTTARPAHSLRQSSDGPVIGWHRSTRALRTAVVLQLKACTSSLTVSELSIVAPLRLECRTYEKYKRNQRHFLSVVGGDGLEPPTFC